MARTAFRPARRTVTALLAASAVVLGGAACSSSDDGSTDASSSTAAEASPDALDDAADSDALDDAVAPDIDTPALAAAENFRDIAGITTAYPVEGGGFMKPGVVYRSNVLPLGAEDQKVLEDLGVTTVIDLRDQKEIATAPDDLPDDITYLNVDIMGHGNPDWDFNNPINDASDALNALIKQNEGFVTDEQERDEWATVFQTIADAEGAVVFHCSSGKDRTGWTAAILQLNAGVSDANVDEDYLATNEFSAASIAKHAEDATQKHGEEMGAAMKVLYSAELSALEAGLDLMTETYGDVEAYLTDGLGLSADTVTTLRTKLTMP